MNCTKRSPQFLAILAALICLSLDSRGMEKFAMEPKPYSRRYKSRRQNRTKDEIA
jgi:hypothetical protein